MKKPKDFASDYGSLPLGILRVIGFFTLVIVLFPVHVANDLFRLPEPFRISQLFHRILAKILGLRVRVHGTMATKAPVFFVSNHTSYLDIPVLAAVIPAAFVAKSEVADWPLIGMLAKMQKTVFIERRTGKIRDQKNVLSERLQKGQSLIVFPEGTSTDGLSVLPFKSSLFSVVEQDAKLLVQPVSVACTCLDGIPLTRELRPYYSWYGDMTLVPHLWNVFKLGGFTVDVIFHSPVTADVFEDRKALSRYCHQQVERGIQQCLTGRDFKLPGEMLQLPARVA